MFRLRQVWQDLRITRSSIIVATILFTVSMYIGGSNDSFRQFLLMQIDALSELVQEMDQSSNPTLTLIMVIFLNNAIKSVLVIFLGAFFGLFPIFFLLVNGMILGFIIQLSLEGTIDISVWDLIFKTLLPHGILEIPALIVAGAYGLRLGRLLFSTMGALITNHNKLDAIGVAYKETLKRCGVMAVYITIILFIAAIIESTLTMWLAST
ncbi:MAG: stage II sporulation protein M [Candidatus Pristimantibacillus lignocellulolyticus]|uniref:Stage II sporulation protein M n=1 Tax=Candidatus Pristimantibacillus lignocellulolyticus TaxID=2994561 RepID=A0A9J6ZJC7_9BACL|nr:MAG: stage II sporulation protein M [Candidatus Pristimantibacillus lignocellulolyticus]